MHIQSTHLTHRQQYINTYYIYRVTCKNQAIVQGGPKRCQISHVATCLKCDISFNDDFVTNLLVMKEYWKVVRIWRNSRQEWHKKQKWHENYKRHNKVMKMLKISKMKTGSMIVGEKCYFRIKRKEVKLKCTTTNPGTKTTLITYWGTVHRCSNVTKIVNEVFN